LTYILPGGVSAVQGHPRSLILLSCLVLWKTQSSLLRLQTRKSCYRKDDRAMRPIYKLFTLILFMLMATILCTDFDSEWI